MSDLRKDLSNEQWQMLEAHLSKPLGDNSKALILDFIDLIDTFNQLEKEFHSLTNAELSQPGVRFAPRANARLRLRLRPCRPNSDLFNGTRDGAKAAGVDSGRASGLL